MTLGAFIVLAILLAMSGSLSLALMQDRHASGPQQLVTVLSALVATAVAIILMVWAAKVLCGGSA